jgi:ADP-L-glycero-D-manno-heptose 6-epimerase
MAETILVTGGAGFIGANLVRALLAQNRKVAVCDRLDHPDKQDNIETAALAALLTPEELPDYLAHNAGEIAAICHLGAVSSTTEQNWQRLQRDNVDATLTVWEWCADHSVPLIYASSAATYGDGSAGFDDEFTLAALDRLQPLNLYGKSKHETDREIRRRLDAGERAPPHWAGLKFFNVYGPHETHKGEMRSIMCKLYEQIAATGKARLFRSERPDYEDGGQLRDFIWVGDCVDIMLWLMHSPKVSGLFNVGTGKPRSFVDVARATFAAMGREPEIEFIDMPLSLRGKYQYYTRAEMQRLRSAGYQQQFTALEDGIGRYVRDHLSRQDRS